VIIATSLFTPRFAVRHSSTISPRLRAPFVQERRTTTCSRNYLLLTHQRRLTHPQWPRWQRCGPRQTAPGAPEPWISFGPDSPRRILMVARPAGAATTALAGSNADAGSAAKSDCATCRAAYGTPQLRWMYSRRYSPAVLEFRRQICCWCEAAKPTLVGGDASETAAGQWSEKSADAAGKAEAQYCVTAASTGKAGYCRAPQVFFTHVSRPDRGRAPWALRGSRAGARGSSLSCCPCAKARV
jgi:hypothetical protein